MQGFRAFTRYFDFVGRSGRAEFWQAVALITVAQVIASIIDFGSLMTAMATGIPSVPMLSTIIWLLTIIPMTAVTVRRLHDRNKSGWTYGGYLIWLIASVVFFLVAMAFEQATGSARLLPIAFAMMAIHLIIACYLFVQLVLPGDDFINDYGPPDNQPFHLPKMVAERRHAAPVEVPGSDEIFSKIERLAELHRRGLISDDEFGQHKSSLLGGIA